MNLQQRAIYQLVLEIKSELKDTCQKILFKGKWLVDETTVYRLCMF